MSHTPGPWEAVELECVGDVIGFKNPDDIPLVMAAPEMLAMLKRLEWCQMTLDDGVTFHETVHYCPKCGYAKTEGHKPTCELAALIARAEGRTPTPAE
jgi:hypothetical protein